MPHCPARRAAILAIGTELTTGQVLNGNAAWLSQRLTDLGIEEHQHLTVADDRTHILAALRYLAMDADLLIVTGGLGPTRDDFTRDVIAEWMGNVPLYFDTPSWERLQERGRTYGLTMVESQKQQCWFPEGAEVIVNPAGTANAFACHVAGLPVWVLPGPPSEIAALWDTDLQYRVQPLLPAHKPTHLYTWNCLGIAESALGELVEAALDGSGWQTGYRAHLPYIEVKVWVPLEQDTDQDRAPWFDRIEKAMGQWVITRMDEDLAALFLAAVPEQEILIVDTATGGLLQERLAPYLRLHPHGYLRIETRWLETEADVARQVEYLLAEYATQPQRIFVIAGISKDGEWALGLRAGEQTLIEQQQVPMARLRNPGRYQRYATEWALKTWREWLFGSRE